MSALFTRAARPAILAAGRSERLRHTAERMPIARDVVRRFVPGEDVTDTDTAEATVKAYLRLLDALGTASGGSEVVKPMEVSLKLSALGQALPKDGDKIAQENAHAICARAQQVGAWVTVDAEDHTTTDSTLSIVRELRAEFDWLGTVLQAYLKRTEADCTEFAAAGARIRLCKGAYDEPASVAYRDRLLRPSTCRTPGEPDVLPEGSGAAPVVPASRKGRRAELVARRHPVRRRCAGRFDRQHRRVRVGGDLPRPVRVLRARELDCDDRARARRRRPDPGR
jgi:hypothetical protein